MSKTFKSLTMVWIILTLAVLTLVGARLKANSDARAVFATSQSNDVLTLSAIGPLNQTLLAVPVDSDSIPCDLFVHAVVADRGLAQRIASHGFTSIRCGNITAELIQ